MFCFVFEGARYLTSTKCVAEDACFCAGRLRYEVLRSKQSCVGHGKGYLLAAGVVRFACADATVCIILMPLFIIFLNLMRLLFLDNFDATVLLAMMTLWMVRLHRCHLMWFARWLAFLCDYCLVVHF